jgi:S-adenosylmethionine synthetase
MPKRVDTVIIACQHEKNVNHETLRKNVIDEVIRKIIPSDLIDSNTKFLVNTSGSFVVGGPFGDSGTTGRKIVCDTYGGFARVGGGCFSSKDPSKVDRTGAYYARFVAKNIVAHNLADRCEIQVSYAIGMKKEISLFIETFGTNKVSMEEIYNYVSNNFNFSVQNMVDELNLLRPIYYDLASYGHFGRTDLDLTWEKIIN